MWGQWPDAQTNTVSLSYCPQKKLGCVSTALAFQLECPFPNRYICKQTWPSYSKQIKHKSMIVTSYKLLAKIIKIWLILCAALLANTVDVASHCPPSRHSKILSSDTCIHAICFLNPGHLDISKERHSGTVKVREESLVTLVFTPCFQWPLTHSESQTDHYLCCRVVWALNDLCCCFLSCCEPSGLLS